jgi:hypothetical protein
VEPAFCEQGAENERIKTTDQGVKSKDLKII